MFKEKQAYFKNWLVILFLLIANCIHAQLSGQEKLTLLKKSTRFSNANSFKKNAEQKTIDSTLKVELSDSVSAKIVRDLTIIQKILKAV